MIIWEVRKKKDETITPGLLAWESREERTLGPGEGVQEGSRPGGANSHVDGDVGSASGTCGDVEWLCIWVCRPFAKLRKLG